MGNRSKRHDNDLLDIFFYRKDQCDFVKEIGTSANIHIYSMEQIGLARKCNLMF